MDKIIGRDSQFAKLKNYEGSGKVNSSPCMVVGVSVRLP